MAGQSATGAASLDSMNSRAVLTRLLPCAWLVSLVGCWGEVDGGGVIKNVMSNPQVYLPLCGHKVAGVRSVEVDARETGRAKVSGVPIALPGMPAAPRCEGEVSFQYSTKVVPTTRGVARQTVSWNVAFLARTLEPGPEIPEDQRVRGLTYRGLIPLSQEHGEVYGQLLDRVSEAREGKLVDEYSMHIKADKYRLSFASLPHRWFWGPFHPKFTLLLGDEVVYETPDVPGKHQFDIERELAEGQYTLRVTQRSDGRERGEYVFTIVKFY